MVATSPIPIITPAEVLSYERILLDVFGVLCDSRGLLPGVQEFCASLRQKDYYILTNSSRARLDVWRSLQRFGLDLEAERIFSSGSLVGEYLKSQGLDQARVRVFGDPPRDLQAEFVEEGEFEVLLFCGDGDFPLLPALNDLISSLLRQPPKLFLLPNPDRIYPQGGGNFGFTAGGLAELVLAGLRTCEPDFPPPVVLGKPEGYLFGKVSGAVRTVMLGDQLETDVAGAIAAGVDAVLVGTGINGIRDPRLEILKPDFFLPGFEA